MSRFWQVVDIQTGVALGDEYPDPELAEADARIRNRDHLTVRYKVQNDRVTLRPSAVSVPTPNPEAGQ